ncbi:MAG: energy-coupling factor transporter transmembrane protein EcfT [Thaumarchaeota archaeon]|nr:energy-coupling factor transporter transmembrane protein EcfT [Candidatus Calditenuaceae archaeon]MDW8187181.1 energy-coupling factor transporter transmembrane component T [Nitrososphaerota archaeon]
MIRRRSAVHPTVSLLALLAAASAATLERDPVHLLPIAAVVTAAASAVAQSPSQVAKWCLKLLPMGLGLGAFALLNSPYRDPSLLALLPLRVWTLTSSALLFAYGTDPWELAWSLSSHLRFPRWMSAAIAVSHTIVVRTLDSLDEVVLALRSKGLLTHPMSYLTGAGHLMRAVLQGLAERAEKLSTALEARGFDPYAWRPLEPLDVRATDLFLLSVMLTAFLSVLIL